jgi:phosphatidylinositol glycan class B
LIEGPWVQTWEYRFGIRSWLLPQIISGPMALGLALDPNGDLHLWFPRLFAAALSLTIVGCATQLGFRLSRLHGLMAGIIAATWFELVFYAPRIQAETISFSLFMGAVWLLLARKNVPQFREFFAAGLLLSLSVLLRAQHGPMLILFALYIVRLDFRQKWLPVILGSLLGLLADVLANVSVGQPPLLWVWESYRIIIIEDRVSRYWSNPFLAYLGMIGIYWGLILAPAILMLTRRGMTHYPILFWAATLNLLLHSLISHKEYRFVMASTGIFIILAAFGMADLLRKSPKERFRPILILTIATWIVGSAALANGFFKPHWTFLNELSKAHEVAHQANGADNGCGFAIFSPSASVAGSYALYRRDRPIYAFDDGETLRANSSAFNLVLTRKELLPKVPSEFKLQSCGDPGMSDTPACVLVRAGGCSGSAAEQHINAWLEKHDN